MAQSSTAKKEEDAIKVAWLGGLRLQAEARGHRIVVDQPQEDGGEDKGMTPVELFVASLGTCIGFYAVRFCQRHGLSSEGLQVRMSWDYAEQPHRIGVMSAKVDLREKLDTAMKDRLQKVLEGCTVQNSISMSPKISVQIGERS